MIDFDALAQISLFDLLARTTTKYPQHIAVIDRDLQLTYTELLDAVEAFASVLVSRGFMPYDRVGLMLPNGIHYVVAYYATQRLGGTVVQVNPLYQQSELDYILEDATPTWFICEPHQAPKIEAVARFQQVNVIYTVLNNRDNVLVSHTGSALPIFVAQPTKDVALIQYTGGTTGKSKGVMLTPFNIIANMHQAGEIFASVIEEGAERILGVSPLTHAMAMTNLNYSVLHGATYIILEKFDATNVLHLIARYRPTYFVGSPTMYIALLNHPQLAKYDLSCFKICLSGSAPLPIEVIKQLEEKTGANILEGYGLTEATTSTHRTPLQSVRKIGSVGVTIPYTEAKIVDIDNGIDELPANTSGELILKGPQIMKGYWQKDIETAATIRNGWLYTGDIATYDEDGFFYIVGRKKDMVIAGGLNIYPAEVEDVLYEHEAVAEACVFGVPDAYLGEKLLAIIVLKDGEYISEQQLLTWCQQKMARYKIPRAIEFRSSIPKTIVGKVLRRQLVDEFVAKT